MAWQIFPPLFSLWIISVSAVIFESIDCGSSDLTTYKDGNSIVWKGDGTLIKNGESQRVQTSDSISKVMDTLRVFNKRKKNCYSFETDAVVTVNELVLVRASFHYGNYDNKSSPPSFDLQFDGKHRTTVETSLDQVVSYEVIYVVKGGSLSVCLAQTKPGQFPFISALEVRSLGASKNALFLKRRVGYGTNKPIRYSRRLTGNPNVCTSNESCQTTSTNFIERLIAQDTPATPDSPTTPDTPDSPTTPDTAPTPDSPATPDSPDSPTTPDTPDSPTTPDTAPTPDSPTTPDTPDSPTTPDTPDSSTTPDTPPPPALTPTTSTTPAVPAAKDENKGSKLTLILGVVVPVVTLFHAIVGVFVLLRCRRRSKAAAVVARNKGEAGQSSPTPMLINTAVDIVETLV